MAGEFQFEKQISGATGRYTARIEGVAGEAEILFAVRGPNLISADHAEAPPSMRGTGVAAALVAHMISDARKQGFSIVPVCSYVMAEASGMARRYR